MIAGRFVREGLCQLRTKLKKLQYETIQCVECIRIYKSMGGNASPTAVHDACILGAVLYKYLKHHFTYAICLSVEFLHTLLVNPNNMN